MRDDYWSRTNLIKMIRENPIKCQKYNYTLDVELMNHFFFDSMITVSEDGQELLISNKKMNTNPRYSYDFTPNQIREQ